jgi:DNA-binding transcriptional LysR family regulator
LDGFVRLILARPWVVIACVAVVTVILGRELRFLDPQVSLEDLRAEPLLIRERGSGTRAALERALGEGQLDLGAFRIVGEMGSTQAIKQAVKASVGLSVLSRRAVEEECKAGLLWCLGIKDLKISRSFHLATHKERSRSPLAEAFRAFVEAEAV